jgi:SAM-dependent methyltransferase
MINFLRSALRKVKINSSRVYLQSFMYDASYQLPVGGYILDAGAGDCLYKPLFSHGNYESADFCEVTDKVYGDITYVCNLTEIPVENYRYDLIICTQVLEHVPEPKEVLNEFFRILKPTGQLWITAPLFYIEHELPHDYFRYTQYGLKYLLECAGFDIIEMSWLEGYYGTLSYQFEVASRNLPLNPFNLGFGILSPVLSLSNLLLRPILLMLSIVFARLDLKHKYVQSGHCKNYKIIARKN